MAYVCTSPPKMLEIYRVIGQVSKKKKLKSQWQKKRVLIEALSIETSSGHNGYYQACKRSLVLAGITLGRCGGSRSGCC